MNALWDRIMAKNDALLEDVLPKSEVKSHIFETFTSKFAYMGSLKAHKQAIWYKWFFHLSYDKICSQFPETTGTTCLYLNILMKFGVRENMFIPTKCKTFFKGFFSKNTIYFD